MAQHMAAPWAETAPGGTVMTPDELLALPEDAAWRYELVEGRLVRMAPPGGEHGEIAGTLHVALGMWVVPRQLGRILAAETGFQLGPNTVLAGDVAFVRADRVPGRDRADRKKYWRLAPDLVVAVASPRQKRDDLEAKAQTWLAAGVRLVWLIWPDARQVDVWRSPPTNPLQPFQALHIGGALDGLDVLPGFTYALADLFA